jgi:hypothetical protein
MTSIMLGVLSCTLRFPQELSHLLLDIFSQHNPFSHSLSRHSSLIARSHDRMPMNNEDEKRQEER